MATHKPFRELIQPGSNFEFIAKQKTWFTISLLVIIGCIAALFVNRATRGDYMNWSTDFKGGTEIIIAFRQPDTKVPVKVELGKVRSALGEAELGEVEVSEFNWEELAEDDSTRRVEGVLVRTPEFGAVDPVTQDKLAQGFTDQFKDRDIQKATWSGDRLFVRSMKPLTWEEAEAYFEKNGHELKPWGDEAARFLAPEEGTGEFNAQFALAGMDAQFQKALADALGKDTAVSVINVYGVGAKAGEKLRNDGVTSLFYAMALIMIYLVVRFDVRYAPGAVVALLHDAIVVIGVFAVTWTEVSLVTVAAILTIIGYSVNDTVVIFDRVRENQTRLKDKKFARILNISVNETLSRSLLTAVTVFAVTLAMNVFSTGQVRNFAFAMNIGVIVGAYSTIFIASPIVLWIHNKWYTGPGRSGGVLDGEPGAAEGRGGGVGPSDGTAGEGFV
jgi:preprotein translocase subunit SecF